MSDNKIPTPNDFFKYTEKNDNSNITIKLPPVQSDLSKPTNINSNLVINTSGYVVKPSPTEKEEISSSYDNTKTDDVTITQDKAIIIYNKFMKRHDSYSTGFALIGIAITCICTALSGSFSFFIDIKNFDVIIKVVLWCIAVYTGFKGVIMICRTKKNKNEYSEEQFINCLFDDKKHKKTK